MVEKSVRQPQTMPTIFTIAHSTRTIAEFVALLQQAAVDLLIDVRSISRSRTNPQFNADAALKRSFTLESLTVICPLLAACATEQRERHHRPIRSDGSRLS
jgi:uncharacterized protein (DUF488 family)